jgi:hypothetical protein
MARIEGIAARECAIRGAGAEVATENRLQWRSSFIRVGLRHLCALGALMLITANSAAACAICLSGWVVTLGQQLDLADKVVLALPENNGKLFRVVEVVKGRGSAGGIITEPVVRVDAAMISSRKPVLLSWNGLAQTWTSTGTVGAEYAGWLRQLASRKMCGKRQRTSWACYGMSTVTRCEESNGSLTECRRGQLETDRSTAIGPDWFAPAFDDAATTRELHILRHIDRSCARSRR